MEYGRTEVAAKGKNRKEIYAAIVTGGARGIGRSTVELLTANGVKVVAGDINPAVNELPQTGKVVALVGDGSEETTARTHCPTRDGQLRQAGRAC